MNTKWITLMMAGLLVLGAAMPVIAEGNETEDGDEPTAEEREKQEERRDAQREKQEERRDAQREKQEERRDAQSRAPSDKPDMKQYCAEHPDNERCQKLKQAHDYCKTSDDERCEKAAKAHEASSKARRAANHIFHAIDALEHRITSLEMKEMRLQHAIDEGNMTANETARAEAKIDRIQDAQDRMLVKITHLQEKLEQLKERWSNVKDHMDKHERVVICHVGEDGNKTLKLPMSAAKAHADHGDTRGACPEDRDSDAGKDEGKGGDSEESSEADGSKESEESEDSDEPDASDDSEESDGSGDGDDSEEPEA